MKFKPLILSLIFILGFTFTIHLIRSDVKTAPDFPDRTIVSGEPEVVVQIPSGASGSDVAAILFKNNVIKSASSYFKIAVADKNSNRVAAGSHRLSLKISAVQALEQLLDPGRIPNLIKVFEGAWKSEVVEMLQKAGFDSTSINSGLNNLVLPAGFGDAEGLLFPAQYSFEKGTTAAEVLQAMIDRFMSEDVGREILDSNGAFSPSELLTIASIVQSEGDTKDFAKVARVILNRLKISMPLQMDSTVHYVKKVRGQIFLSKNSTLIKSPYNTYQHYGLPPTPISNPGVYAMEAALNPAQGDWLYFITVAPGDTRFTSTISEFNSWKSLYVSNRKKGLFN